MTSENANQKERQRSFPGRRRSKQNRIKTLLAKGRKKEREVGFNRKTTLHTERKMHKAQRTTDEGRHADVAVDVATTDRTKRGKKKRIEQGRERERLQAYVLHKYTQAKVAARQRAKAIEPCLHV